MGPFYSTQDINLASAMIVKGFKFQGCEYLPEHTNFLFNPELTSRGKILTAEAFRESFEFHDVKLDAWTVLEAHRELTEKVSLERLAAR